SIMSRKARRKKEKRFRYRGHELDEFAEARVWKRYCASFLRPYLTGEVLEVGAGIGEFTRVLLDDKVGSWTCLEPDAKLAARIQADADPRVQVRVGRVQDLDEARGGFDCIVYNDVLEHIRDDRGELAAAARRLADGGALCVISPAHQWLYTEF